MKLANLTLASAALGIGAIGLGYLIAPRFMFGLYGIDLQSVNEFNMVRSAYGGLFAAFACLFAAGASRPSLQKPALIGLLTFMAGFAFGRLLSILIEGVPSPLIIGLLALEVAYAGLAAHQLIRKG